ncbi:erlin-2-B-like protein [Carex littledalei]|uniref:Erlin-2-B-like protein n=1 Tax=Carex littledalei TaxID=544730 RepID=A0A833R2X7_9POAL|nr:erlin-2-B-like protein [Carex littledalei]
MLACTITALIAIEKQKVAEKEAETQKKIALSEAEKNAQVSLILMEQKLMDREGQRQMPRGNRVVKEAEANRLKLTPEFLELKFIEAIANNTKIFFGDKMPNMIMDKKLLGSFLDSINRKDLINDSQ